MFSYNHVNEQHKKIDWTIRGVTIVLILGGFIYNTSQPPEEWLWFLEPWVWLLFLTFTSGLAQAFMQWKFAKNKNAYLLTLSELAFSAFLIVQPIALAYLILSDSDLFRGNPSQLINSYGRLSH